MSSFRIYISGSARVKHSLWSEYGAISDVSSAEIALNGVQRRRAHHNLCPSGVFRVMGVEVMSGPAVRRNGRISNPEMRTRREATATIKHRGMMEKKLERFFLESEQLGWSYDNFAASVLEILTVLHHRNHLR
jgi:hypothetical protein